MKRDLPRGVVRSKKSFRASLNISGKRVDLGCFSTPEAASEAYKKARAANVDQRYKYDIAHNPKGKVQTARVLTLSIFPKSDPHHPSLSALWNPLYDNT